ncbi:MAG TPA: universal stress protein [Longimicrobium sp.]|nr:universal stress protein [Longimicrobium sp.]
MSTPTRHIVAGIATLDRDDPALVPSIRLAERTGAELHLVHAFAPGEVRPEFEERRGGKLRDRLEAEVRALSQRDRITCRAVCGRPGDVLPALAAELGADLLVLGHTRRGGAAAAVLGTTAQRVLRASTVPVLSLHAGALRTGYGRVLLATDLSPHSAQALTVGARVARFLARPIEPRLHPLYVTVAAYQAAVAGIPGWAPENVDAELAEFLGELPDFVGQAGAVRTGEAAGEILAEAAEWKADLVVVGTHGRRGVPRLLLGSVAETVLRRASTSVLVIPPATVPDASPPLERPRESASVSGASETRAPAAEASVSERRSTVPTRCVVAGTDLSSASDHVLRSAAAVAGATGAELHVIHAFDFASPVYMGRRVDRVTFQDRIAAAEAALDAQVARTVPHEVAVTEKRVEIYAAHRAIAEHAEAVGAELVVIGAHAHHGSHLGVLGSTTDHLVRTLEVPCLVVRSELGIPLHRIVVPLDLSDPARAALEVGLRWAGSLGARGQGNVLPETEVAVVHVVPQLFAVADPPFGRATVPPGLNPEVDAAVSAVGSPSHVLVREEVRWNDRPADEIVSFAWHDRADLIVMATHGDGPVKRALVGSTACSVLRRAPCPVLVIPPALWRRPPSEDASDPAEVAEPALEAVAAQAYRRARWRSARRLNEACGRSPGAAALK